MPQEELSGRKEPWLPPDQWLNGILETIGDAVITIDSDHRVIFFNKEATRIFGYPPEAILGQNLSMLLPVADRSTHARHVEAFAGGLQLNRFMGTRSEIRGQRRDGTIFWAEATISRMETATGTLFTAVLRDITARREMEQELRDAFVAISEATAAKARFFLSLSHELRTPLNAILGLSEIMAQELLGPHGQKRYREYCTDIHRSGVHLLDLIEEVMNFATAEYDEMPLNEGPVDIDALWSESIQIETKLLAAANIRANHTGVYGRVLWADRLRIQQLIINLLRHARRMCPFGGEIRLCITDAEDGGLMLSVTDSGPGMTAEQIATAFEPIRRDVPDYMGGGQSGLGLGLPIARRLASLHGAAISLANIAGGGTRVSVTFPAERVGSRLQPTPPPTQPPVVAE